MGPGRAGELKGRRWFSPAELAGSTPQAQPSTCQLSLPPHQQPPPLSKGRREAGQQCQHGQQER